MSLYDKTNMINTLNDFPQQIEEATKLGKDIKISKKISNIIITGMGSSGVSGQLIRHLAYNAKIPIKIINSHKLPGFVNNETLCIIISYSGDTAETLNIFNEAKKTKAQIITLSSGGQLTEISKKSKTDHIDLPQNLISRLALGYFIFPVINILNSTKTLKVSNKEIEESIEIIKDTEWFNKKGYFLAKKLTKKIPLIYSSEFLGGVAYRWKTMFNENSKVPAFYNTFPEINHNEIMSYKKMSRKFELIVFKDEDDQSLKKTLNLGKKIFDKKIFINEVDVKGKSLLAKMMYLTYLGDFTSYHLALLGEIDPANNDLVEKMKLRL